MGDCTHLAHTPKGICLGCGEQHQPLPGYSEQELEQREAEFWAEREADERSMTPNITEVVERVERARKEHCEKHCGDMLYTTPHSELCQATTALLNAARSERPAVESDVPRWQPMSRVPKHGQRIYALQRGGKASVIYANPELDRSSFLAWWPLPEHGRTAIGKLDGEGDDACSA